MWWGSRSGDGGARLAGADVDVAEGEVEQRGHEARV
eukprot:COSAG04_NODE_26594_length_293_cov_0.752577_2_plen_35_part_01